MYPKALGVVLAFLCAGTPALAAQEPRQHAPPDSAAHAAMMMNMQQHMRTMDSANTRLDGLVERMNRASGNAKVAAMAEVINELVAQRRTMQAHMRQMMRSYGGMRHRETEAGPH
jgi:hypothetical protein